MPSGWVRWILEQFAFPFEVVYPPRFDAGDLRKDFDVLILPGEDRGARPFGEANDPPEDMVEQYRDQMGQVSVEKTVPHLRTFLEAGGRIVTVGNATELARHLGLPIGNHLEERQPDGRVRPLPRGRFYIPASLLEVRVDPTAPSARGMEERTIVLFDNNPVFRLPVDAAERGIRPVAWFPSAKPLVSGWAWGQTYLEGGIAAVEAKVGSGTLYLFGPEITFRSQPHGTYKLLFNALVDVGR